MSEPSLESNRMPDEQDILHISYRELTERTLVNEIYLEEDE